MISEDTKTFKFTSFGETLEGRLRIGSYAYNNNLAIALESYDPDFHFWEPYTTLTVNIEDFARIAPDKAWVTLDTNNFPGGEKLLTDLGIGKREPHVIRSGFCEYPIYEIDLDELKKYDPEGFKQYDDLCFGREPASDKAKGSPNRSEPDGER